MHLRLSKVASPIAPLLLVTDTEGTLRALDFSDNEQRMHGMLRGHYDDFVLESSELPNSIAQALDAYFAGDLGALDDIRTATGGTSFQLEVWKELRAIKAGRTKSYGELAAAVGRPKASRAVGAANGSNPISIVVPCHRVIGANGTLTGYGGGLPRKRWLLEHEQRYAACQAASNSTLATV